MEDEIKEIIWKPIFGSYEVSSDGCVRNTANGITLKLYKDKCGYLIASLSKNGKTKKIYVQRLVAGAFLENPNNLPEVNHKDGNKTNNDVENLEWVSGSENCIHAIYTDLNDCRREVNQYDVYGKFIKRWKSMAEASRALNISIGSISSNCSGKSDYAGDFIWEYVKYKEIIRKEKFIPTDDFVDIQGFPDYMISPKGQVYSKKERILMSYMMNGGYRRVGLWNRQGKKKTPRVNVLVAKHFIPNPKNLPIANHKDGNKLNNNVENLEWVSHSENTRHAVEMGLLPPVNEAPVLQYDLEGNFIKEYKSIAEASRQTGIHRRAIGKNCKGETKTSGGYVWKHKFPEKVLNSNPKEEVLKGNQLRQVAQLDKEDNLIKVWKNVIEASEKLNIRRGYIFRVCRKDTASKTAGGYVWTYVDELKICYIKTQLN